MDVTIGRAALAQELGLARRIADRKTTQVILGYALLDAAMGGIDLTATDAESGFRTRIPAEVTDGGRVLVPIKTLHEITRTALADTIHLVAEGHRIKLTAGSYKSSLPTLAVDDFPTVPAPPDAATDLATPAFRSALTKVKFVAEAASGSTNYHLHGALLQLKPHAFTLVATDGHRVAIAKGPAPAAAPDDQALIPRRTLDDLVALLSTDDAAPTVAYARDDYRVFFTAGPRQLISPMINATFPNYERVMPQTNGHRVDVDRDAWLGALRRVMIVATEGSMRVKLTIQPTELVTAMGTADVGEASEPIAVEAHGDGWVSAFDSKCLADFLQAAEPGLVTYDQVSDRTPAAFRSAPGEVDYVYVLAPMDIR